MTKFVGFNVNQLARIANSLGYEGPMGKFHEYLQETPEAMEKYNYIQKSVADMVDAEEGEAPVPVQEFDEGGLVGPLAGMGDTSIQRMANPALPDGGTMEAAKVEHDATQDIAAGTGQVAPTTAIAPNVAKATQGTATAAPTTAANTTTAKEVAQDVANTVNGNQAAQGNISDTVTPAQAAAVLDSVNAAQGTAGTVNRDFIDNRTVGANELVEGATANQADVTTTLAQAGDTSVSGQMAKFEQDFADGNVPAWAAGPIRHANAAMLARGLGASSMAGMAIVQASLEAAIPIAQGDANAAMEVAKIRAQFLGQEFDQSFQTKVMNAQKISEVANMKFTAEQTIGLENARMAQTMDLSNLTNNQAVVMAKAAELSQVNMANLNNKQQAEVQNAQSFLQMDMANLTNEQQTAMFNTQQKVQSLFTDQAATNASRQFNATSENQTDQFFANVATQVSQFNAAQKTAIEQSNAGAENAAKQFDKTVENQRDQFNAQNALVISQSNSRWRRDIATADNAAQNYANQVNAESILNMSNQAYDNLWQNYRDTMEWAFIGGENERDRVASLKAQELRGSQQLDIAEYQADAESSASIGGFIGDVLDIFF